jgi:hypothetical protein
MQHMRRVESPELSGFRNLDRRPRASPKVNANDKEDAEAPADAEKVIALINSTLPAKTFGDAINSGQTRADPSRGRPQARTATSWSWLWFMPTVDSVLM